MTTFKPGSTLTTENASDPGILIRAATSGQASTSQLFAISDFQNAPIFTVPNDQGSGVVSYVYGDHFRVYQDVLTPGSYIGFDGTRNPTPLEMPDGASAQGPKIWAGTGAPSSTTIGGAAALGDIYFRRDGSAGSYVYHCTTAGTPGTWTARL